MAAALYTDVKRKGGRSAFNRPGEGLFGLREWGEGVVEVGDGGGGAAAAAAGPPPPPPQPPHPPSPAVARLPPSPGLAALVSSLAAGTPDIAGSLIQPLSGGGGHAGALTAGDPLCLPHLLLPPAAPLPLPPPTAPVWSCDGGGAGPASTAPCSTFIPDPDGVAGGSAGPQAAAGRFDLGWPAPPPRLRSHHPLPARRRSSSVGGGDGVAVIDPAALMGHQGWLAPLGVGQAGAARGGGGLQVGPSEDGSWTAKGGGGEGAASVAATHATALGDDADTNEDEDEDERLAASFLLVAAAEGGPWFEANAGGGGGGGGPPSILHHPPPRRPPASSSAAMEAEITFLLAAVTAPPPPPAAAPSPTDLARLEESAALLSSRLGAAHPQVGKAWLLLARGHAARRGVDPTAAAAADAALERAYAVCLGQCGGGGDGGRGESAGAAAAEVVALPPPRTHSRRASGMAGVVGAGRNAVVAGPGAAASTHLVLARARGAGAPTPGTLAALAGVRKAYVPGSRSGKRNPGSGPRSRKKKG